MPDESTWPTQVLFSLAGGHLAQRDNLILVGHARLDSDRANKTCISLAGSKNASNAPRAVQPGSLIIRPPKLQSYLRDGGAPPQPVRSFRAVMEVSLDRLGSGRTDGVSFGYGLMSGEPFNEEGDRRAGAGGLWISIDTYPHRTDADGLNSLSEPNDSCGLSVWYGAPGCTPELVRHFQVARREAFEKPRSRLVVDVAHTGVLTLQFHPGGGEDPSGRPPLIDATFRLENWDPRGAWAFGTGARTAQSPNWHVLHDLVITERSPSLAE